jgi:hypothetical protein
VLDNVGRLIGAYADRAGARAPVRTMGDAAPRLGERKRSRRLRWAIIAAAILTVLGARACSERQSFSPPPPPSPPRMGALEGGADAGRLAGAF